MSPLLALAVLFGSQEHGPLRPLPEPSRRPMGEGPASFVDPAKGDDAADGTRERPWKTLGRALQALAPGHTIHLRGGTSYERVKVAASGAPGKPATIRSYPGERVILDGGLREFLEKPAASWAPDGEAFVSTRAYPGLGHARGHFGDSMIPLFPYRFALDLTAANEYWNADFQDGGKLTKDKGIYCGPGLWWDPQTGLLRARLAHTKLDLPKGFFPTYRPWRGETDPRKVPLAVAGGPTTLEISGARHLRVWDLEVRGATKSAVLIQDAEDVELDHVTVHGGAPSLEVQGTRGLRLTHSALRGLSTPWTFRTIKYRGPAPYLFIARGKAPQNRDFEIAHCEFTDSHDFFLPSVDGLDFHHNLVDNFDDDGIYLSGDPPNARVRIHENRFSRCLTTFSFAGKHGTGPGVHIYRNVFDLRVPIHRSPPEGPGQARLREGVELSGQARIACDHGSPTWEPMFAYHNTVLLAGPEDFRTAAVAWGGHVRDTRRRVFNNVFVQLEGLPRFSPGPAASDDFQADGNVHWSPAAPAGADPVAEFRRSKDFEASKAVYPPGWRARDRFADPGFASLPKDVFQPADLSLVKGGAAVDAGVAVPQDWPDPLRGADSGAPDAGALPLGAVPWRIGIDGRFSVSP